VPRRTLPRAMLPALLACARTARAEVLDKVAAPWETSLLGTTLVVVAVVCALAASKWKSLRAGGVALALVWAAIRLGGDEWFSDDVGPPLRVELGEGASLWFGAMLAEAFAPFVLVLVVVVLRRRRDAEKKDERTAV
jgi:hypothetical protein